MGAYVSAMGSLSSSSPLVSLVQVESARDQDRSREHRCCLRQLLYRLIGLFHPRQGGKPVLPIELTLETLVFITLTQSILGRTSRFPTNTIC